MRCDTERWRKDNESKTTFAIYNRFNREISGEKIYVNDYIFVLQRLCVGLAEVETVEHFLLECCGLGEEQQMSGVDRGRGGNL